MVQTFGKYKVNLPKSNIDAISASFHKLHGPAGCGLLVINNDLLVGYGMESQIGGTQQGGFRGGTENVAAIAASIVAMKQAFTKRADKNKKMMAMKKSIIKSLASHHPFGDYRDYVSGVEPAHPVEFVVLGQTDDSRALPNTLLLAVAKTGEKSFCNVRLKKDMGKEGVIISVGSACNTSSDKASHVLESIKAPPIIKHGVVRISLSDTTTNTDISQFIKIFIAAVTRQL
jgi:cysteine desulfurase